MKTKYAVEWVKKGLKSSPTGAKDEVQQLAEDEMQGGVGDGGKAGGCFQSHPLLLLG